MIDVLLDELMRENGLPYAVILMRVVGAALLSGIIGLERELKKDTAGLRTHMLISVASAIFALLSLQLMQAQFGAEEVVRLDPLRLIEAVTGGVAFLAAGIVVYTRGNVKGLTTGAGMWLAASIGLACGLGYWSIALTASAAGVLLIAVLRRLEYALGVKD